MKIFYFKVFISFPHTTAIFRNYRLKIDFPHPTWPFDKLVWGEVGGEWRKE